MSHFTVLVLTENGTDEEVAALLAPYDENLEAPEYDKRCYCVGREAQTEVDKAMSEKHGRWDDFRAKFHERADIAAARREGVIEGLERALRFVAPFVLQEHSDRIRAEIERLREVRGRARVDVPQGTDRRRAEPRHSDS